MGVYLIPAVDAVAYGLLLFLAAAGLTLALGVGRVLNLAHGATYAAGAYLAAVSADGTWTGLAVGVVAGTGIGAAVGGIVAVAVAPLAGRGHLAQALATFGLALIAGDVLVAVFGPDERRVPVPPPLAGSVAIAGQPYPGYRLAAITVAATVAVVGWWLLTRTRAGAIVRAAVDDPQMLACTGTNPAAVGRAVLVAAGGLAGLAGAVGAPVLGAGPTTAATVLLLSLVVVVVGGLGSVPGAAIAAVGVGMVQTVGVTAVPALAPYLLFAALAVALVTRRPTLARGALS